MLLINFGFKVGFIDNHTPKSQRPELIKKFQKKEINCLLNFDKLPAIWLEPKNLGVPRGFQKYPSI